MSSSTPSTPLVAAVIDATLKGAHPYYYMLALCEGTIPPRLSPLKLVDDPQQRTEVVKRILGADGQSQAAINHGRDVLQDAIMVGFRVARDAYRLPIEVKQAMAQALTLDEVLNLEARLHEPHPGAQENNAESLLAMVAAMNHALDSTAALDSWVTTNIVPIIDATAYLAAGRCVLTEHMEAAPIPSTVEKENAAHAPAYTFGPSLTSLAQRTQTSNPFSSVLSSVPDPANEVQSDATLQSNGAWLSLSAFSGWLF
ncbi:hypothetical protein GGF50DRAFT_46799 [Schizophyllum commune]